jgi:hypothetical protein
MNRKPDGGAINWKIWRRLIRRLGLALAIAAIAAPAAPAAPGFSEGAGVADSQAPFDPVSSVPTDSLGRPLPRPEPTDSTGDVEPASSSLDWVYVGLGFVAVGLLLFGGGALIIGRQNRKSRLAGT